MVILVNKVLKGCAWLRSTFYVVVEFEVVLFYGFFLYRYKEVGELEGLGELCSLGKGHR